MGWAFVISLLVMGVTVNILYAIDKDNQEQKRLRGEKVDPDKMGACASAAVTIGMIWAVFWFLYVLYWVWYFVCSGFLVLESESLLDKIVYFIISMVLLVVLVGGVLTAFNKR